MYDERNARSVSFIQGGASVISSFLRGLDHDARKGGHDGEADRSSGHLVDRVVVTIAPAFLRGFNVLASSPKTAAGRGDPSGVSTGGEMTAFSCCEG